MNSSGLFRVAMGGATDFRTSDAPPVPDALLLNNGIGAKPGISGNSL